MQISKALICAFSVLGAALLLVGSLTVLEGINELGMVANLLAAIWCFMHAGMLWHSQGHERMPILIIWCIAILGIYLLPIVVMALWPQVLSQSERLATHLVVSASNAVHSRTMVFMLVGTIGFYLGIAVRPRKNYRRSSAYNGSKDLYQLRHGITAFSVIGMLLILLTNQFFGVEQFQAARESEGFITRLIPKHILTFCLFFLVFKYKRKLGTGTFVGIWIFFVLQIGANTLFGQRGAALAIIMAGAYCYLLWRHDPKVPVRYVVAILGVLLIALPTLYAIAETFKASATAKGDRDRAWDSDLLQRNLADFGYYEVFEWFLVRVGGYSRVAWAFAHENADVEHMMSPIAAAISYVNMVLPGVPIKSGTGLSMGETAAVVFYGVSADNVHVAGYFPGFGMAWLYLGWWGVCLPFLMGFGSMAVWRYFANETELGFVISGYIIVGFAWYFHYSGNMDLICSMLTTDIAITLGLIIGLRALHGGANLNSRRERTSGGCTTPRHKRAVVSTGEINHRIWAVGSTPTGD